MKKGGMEALLRVSEKVLNIKEEWLMNDATMWQMGENDLWV